MKLNYKVYGEGNSDVLIILHGLFGMLDNWTTLAKQFSEHYLVYTIDQRNHGKSPHNHEMDYEIMADDLNDFMEEHNIYTANLIGHSMGGKTVMCFTNKYPERVERLVVVDIAPKAYAPKHSLIIDALLDLPIKNINTRADADEWLKSRIDNFGIRQFLLKNLNRNKDGFSWKMNLDTIVANYNKIIGDVNISNGFDRPVLVLYGGSSDYVSNNDKAILEKEYGHVFFEEIEDAGHWVHAEKPIEFFETITDFLEEPLF